MARRRRWPASRAGVRPPWRSPCLRVVWGWSWGSWRLRLSRSGEALFGVGAGGAGDLAVAEAEHLQEGHALGACDGHGDRVGVSGDGSGPAVGGDVVVGSGR